MLTPRANERTPAQFAGIWPTRLRCECTGHKRQDWNESQELLLDRTRHEHALDAMLHWRDPVERLWSVRRRRTLIDDNPCSG